jgi:hypothetical protein
MWPSRKDVTVMPGNHPDRDEMLRAIVTGSVPFKSHLARCETCRMLFELLSIHRAEAPDSLISVPPVGALYRQMAISRLAESRNPERSVSGAIIFDSWQHLPVSQTRDAAPGLERRMRLKSDQYLLELIGDRQLREWDFVARVYDRARVTREFILKVGRRKLYPELQDCFFWSSARPPRRIQLLSPSLRVDFGNIKW